MQRIFRTRIFLFLSTYFLLTFLLVIQKPIFLLFQRDLSSSLDWSDWFSVIGAGLTMDLSMAGYLMVIPGVLILLSVFTVKYVKNILKIYFIIISILISVIFIPDLNLYSYWGFRIDSTIFTYIDSPTGVFASLPLWQSIAFFILTFLWSLFQFFILNQFVAKRFPQKASKHKINASISILVLFAMIFITIRGGLTTSTMNPGYAYFSNNMFMNHAALNPVFNFFYSLKGKKDFNKQYRFMEDDVAESIFNDLMDKNGTDSIPQLLNTDRPNIVFIMLESFGKKILEPFEGEEVAPNLVSLTKEGVFFPNMYANSFRTDRGIVSILGGYPAQPNMSILKYTKKVQALNSIPKSLIENGYSASFLYGGDLKFAQMELFIISQKITDITDDKDFPLEFRMTKWGVPDAYTFRKLEKKIQEENKEPYAKFFLTLSSHEPFDVPTRRFSDPYLNSVAYTDSCLAEFIDKLKQSPDWERTLVVLVPDHDMRYPSTLDHYHPERHDIFMLWLGGAVKQPVVIDKICSQVDIAATLLEQLNILTDKFVFSRDILKPETKGFAFYTYSNGFGMISDEGKVVYNHDSKSVILEEGMNADNILMQGKAYLQYLYDDIQKR